jgi:hypothetical protein
MDNRVCGDDALRSKSMSLKFSALSPSGSRFEDTKYFSHVIGPLMNFDSPLNDPTN